MILTTLLAVPCLAAPAAPLAQNGVVVFQGSPGLAGNVAVVDPVAGTPAQHPAGLQGILLLDLDFNGRTEVQQLLPGRPRRIELTPGTARLALPGGNGSLYRFSRVEPGGGTTFGLMWIDAGGAAHSVLELPGTGPAGDVAPFDARLAVDPAGGTVLVATTLAAGGDLLELDLASASVLDRTAALAPLDFGTAGLALSPTWGIAACADRVLRFRRGVPGDALPVPFGASPPRWFSEEVVLSPAGLFAATVAGAGPTLADAWVFGPTGSAVKASKIPMALSGAGFLPESSHGPYLAVSDDGTRCAWRTEGATREAYMAVVPLSGGATTSVHVTADELYLDTLDEIGQFFFRLAAQTLVLSVGELPAAEAPGPGIENLDFYEAQLSPEGATGILNLTVSNGLVAPPFLVPSTLQPQGIALLPTGELVLHDSQNGVGDLISAVPGQSGIHVQIADVKSLDWLEPAGSRLVAVVRRSSGNKDREVWTLPASLTGPPTLALSMPDVNLVARMVERADGWVGFVEVDPLKERLWLLDASSGALRKFRRLLYGPTLAFAPSGELIFSVGAAGTPAVQGAMPPTGSPFRLKLPVAPGFVLPGAN